MTGGRGDGSDDASSPPARCPPTRAVLVAVTAAVIVALVVSVGGPPDADAGASAGTGTAQAAAGSPSPGMALDRAQLSRWCQDVLATPDAQAMVAHRVWGCVGRAGGIWRREPIFGPELCRHLGYRGESTATTEDAIVCLA